MIRLSLCVFALSAVASAPSSAQTAANAAAAAPAALPEGFHGKVSYFGNHSGEVIAMRPGGPARAAGSKCTRSDQRCPTPIGGSVQIDLYFMGDVVRGTFRGTGGLRESELIGRRIGSSCRLFDTADGSAWAGRCDFGGFQGNVKSVPNAPVQIGLAFDTLETRSIDFDAIRARREEARLRADHIEMLRARLMGSAPIEYRFDVALELDSYGWTGNSYVPGRLNAVKRRKDSIYAEFPLAGGGSGWARAQLANGDINCIELWELPGVCRAILKPRPFDVPELADADREPDWFGGARGHGGD